MSKLELIVATALSEYCRRISFSSYTLIRSAYPKSHGRIELRPANPDFNAHVYSESEITIRGVVVALQREY